MQRDTYWNEWTVCFYESYQLQMCYCHIFCFLYLWIDSHKTRSIIVEQSFINVMYILMYDWWSFTTDWVQYLWLKSNKIISNMFLKEEESNNPEVLSVISNLKSHVRRNRANKDGPSCSAHRGCLRQVFYIFMFFCFSRLSYPCDYKTLIRTLNTIIILLFFQYWIQMWFFYVHDIHTWLD